MKKTTFSHFFSFEDFEEAKKNTIYLQYLTKILEELGIPSEKHKEKNSKKK